MRSVPAALDDPVELVASVIDVQTRRRRRGNAVGRSVETVGEDPAIGQRSVAPMANAVNRRPTDSATISVLPSGVMTIPLGKSRSPATTVTVSSRVDPHDDAALTSLGSDVRTAEVVDDHVAEARRHDVGQVGDGRDGFAVVAQYLPVLGRGDQQRPVGTESQTGRRVTRQRQLGHVPVQVDGVHRLAEHVGEPQQALEPSGPLAEAESIGKRRQRRTFTNHAISVTLAGCHCQLPAALGVP